MKLWMQIITTLLLGLVLFNPHGMSLCPGVLPDTGHLLGDFHRGCTSCNLKTIAGNFLCNIEIGSWSTNGGKLITEIGVEGLEPCRKFDLCFTVGIENHYPIINVLHIR